MSQLSFLDSVIAATSEATKPAVVISSNHNYIDGCHNLAVTAAGKVSMFSTLKTPWHGLGNVISHAATRDEALKFGGLAGWDLQKLEQVVDWNGEKLATGAYAIVRGDTKAVLTHGKSVGARYEIVSNEELFGMMDQVIQDGTVRYETAGALGKGERVWMLAKMPGESEIAKGDTVEHYAMLMGSHDGSLAIKLFPTTVRAVCQNTVTCALNKHGNLGISMRHTTNVAVKVNEARKALGLAAVACEQYDKTARQLASTQMAKPDDLFRLCLDDLVDVTVAEKKVTEQSLRDGSILKSILEIASVDDRRKAEEKLEKAKDRRVELLDVIRATYENERNNGMPSIAGTAWAAVNAVSETVQHGNVLRYNGSDTVKAESRFDSVLNGKAQEVTQAAIGYAQSLSA